MSKPIRSARYRSATHDGFIYAGRGIPVPRNSLTCYTARHLRIRRLVQFILADPVYYNALTNCAARLCRACVELTTCVAERYLTCEQVAKDTEEKNPLPFPFSKRSHIGNLRQIRKQGKGRSSKRKENRRLSFLAHRRGRGVPAGRGTAPAVRRRRIPRLGYFQPPPPAERQLEHPPPGVGAEKAPRRKGRTTPAQFGVPRSAGAERSRLGGAGKRCRFITIKN